MLMNADRRSADIGRYLAATASGISALNAWHQVFPDLTGDAGLSAYLGQIRFRSLEYRFKRALERQASDVTRVSPSEAEAVLGKVLATVAPAREAEAQLQRATELQPGAERAVAWLGQFRIQHGSDADGRKLLLKAAESDDWVVCYAAATSLTHLLLTYRSGDNDSTVGGARKALSVVLAARPNLPNALAMKAAIGMFTATQLEESLTAIRLARRQTPGRGDFAFIEAGILAQQREFAAARSVVAPWMSSLNPPAVRERARNAMVRLLQQENSAAAPLRATPLGPTNPPGNSQSSNGTLLPAGEPSTILDACCREYMEALGKAIDSHWNSKQSVSGRVQIAFSISRDGTLTDIKLERSSGYLGLDTEALRAVRASSPVPPLPAEYTDDRLVVHLVLEYRGSVQ